MSMLDWIEADEAAEMLGRSPRQVLRYAAARRVKTRRIGQRQVYSRSDVEQLAAELEKEARPARPENIAPEMSRALVETLSLARELIAAQRDLLAAREENERLRAEMERQKQRYLGIIRRMLEGKQ